MPHVPIFQYKQSEGCTDCANIKRAQSYCSAVNQKLMPKCPSKYCCLQQNCGVPKTNSAFYRTPSAYKHNLLCRCTPNVDFTRLDVSLQYLGGESRTLRVEPFAPNYCYKPSILSPNESVSGTTAQANTSRDCCCDSISNAMLTKFGNYSYASDRDIPISRLQPNRGIGIDHSVNLGQFQHSSECGVATTKSTIGNRFHLSVTLPTSGTAEQLESVDSRVCMGNSGKGHLCLYCGKFYSRKYGLKIHLRTHTGYKPLKCKFCFRPFGDPSNLNKHIRLHAEGDTPYRCDFCGKVLVRRRDLERHVKSRHPSNVCEETVSFIKEESPTRAENTEAEQSDDITIAVDDMV